MKFNKNSNLQNFNFISQFICSKYSEFEYQNIQAIFIKELPDADLLLQNKSSSSNGKTVHIACTSQCRDFFSSFIANAYINKGHNDYFYDNTCNDYKFKLFIEGSYLNNTTDKFISSHCALWIIPKDENQIGLSKEKFDDANFFKLRKMMYKGNIVIFFKYLNPNTNLEDYYLILVTDTTEINYIIDNIGKLERKPQYAEKLGNELFNSISVRDSSFNSYSKNIGINKIFYGCPGVGKSYNINKDYSCNTFRTTFHPEYTYYDFVGSIRPQIDYSQEKPITSYEFVPGDFTLALKYAIANPNETVNFIIEELNRANTSAVFGDIFQLLDRDSTGISEYYITNKNISNVIYNNSDRSFILDWLNTDIEKHQVKIPNNLNIIASMNTSDQNINALDSAFTRRWDTEYIPIDFYKLDEDFIIDGLNINWSIFAQKVNEKILSSDMLNAEDKQLGPFFAKESTITSSTLFSNKILVYLWKDVFKVNKSIIFNTDNIKGINSLINSYSTNPSSVFNDDFLSELGISDPSKTLY